MAAPTRRDRFEAMLAGCDEDTRQLCSKLIDDLVWQEQRLEDTRRLIKATPVVLTYDNGGGQRGVRRNPAYDGYHALFKSYTSGLRTLREITGVKVRPDAEKPGKLADMRRRSPAFKAV